MKHALILLLALTSLCASAHVGADKIPKYKATIWVFPYGEIEGDIYVNLYGANAGKTTIELYNKTEKNDLSVNKKVEKIEVLTAAIKLIKIDTLLYKFINFRSSPSKLITNYCVSIDSEAATTYQLLATDTSHFALVNIPLLENGVEKTLFNCSLKKVYGKDSFAIYQFGLVWDENLALIALPKYAANGQLKFINDNYFTASSVWRSSQFRGCTILADNIREQKEGWVFTDKSTQAEKIKVWKLYIDTRENCGPK